MRILLIHQAFVSPQESGGTRHFEFALYCMKQGYEFSIVASDLNYLTGRPVVSKKSLITEESIEGIKVLRVYTYPSLHRSFIWRVFSFLSFMATSIWAALTIKKIDLVMGTTPPMFQAISAWIVSVIRRKPFLLEVRDLWPEFAIDMGILKNSFLIRLSRWLERFLYARASHIVVNSPAYRNYITDKGISKEKISLIPNGVDVEKFQLDSGFDREALRRELGLEGKFVVVYTGALGVANDIPTILNSARYLIGEKNIHFLLVGDGKERSNLELMAKTLKLSNITFIGSRPKSEIPKILAISNLCIATLKNIPMFRTTYPNKVFDYMAAGRPTLLAIDGVIREVIESAKGGYFVPPGEPVPLAEMIKELSVNPKITQQMGDSAKVYVREHFSRNHQAEQFIKLLKNMGEIRDNNSAITENGH